MAQTLVINLRITAEEYLKLYSGAARSVVATATTGQTVRFPANILRQFVTRDGIRGSFVIHFDNNNRFLGVERLG